jgi:hypothetical protein
MIYTRSLIPGLISLKVLKPFMICSRIILEEKRKQFTRGADISSHLNMDVFKKKSGTQIVQPLSEAIVLILLEMGRLFERRGSVSTTVNMCLKHTNTRSISEPKESFAHHDKKLIFEIQKRLSPFLRPPHFPR